MNRVISCLSPLWAQPRRNAWDMVPAVEWHRLWPCGTPCKLTHPGMPVINEPSAFSEEPLPISPCRMGPRSQLSILFLRLSLSRRYVKCVQRSGAFWIRGRPSTVGRALIRTLLPHAVTYAEPIGGSLLWVVAHAGCPELLVSALSALCGVDARVARPAVLPLRASTVYRTKSLDRS